MKLVWCGLALSMVALWTVTAFGEEQAKSATTQPSEGLIVETLQTVKMRGVNPPPSRTVTRYKGSKSRTDLGESASSITLPNGDVAQLMHAQRIYVVMPRGLLKEGLDRAADMGAIDAPDGATTRKAPTFAPTGKTERIAGYETKGYTLELSVIPGQKTTITYWYASDYPNAEAISAFLKKVNSTQDNPWAVDPAEAPPGLAIRTEFTQPGGAVVINDIVSANFAELDDSLFEIPAGYKRMDSNMQMPR